MNSAVAHFIFSSMRRTGLVLLSLVFFWQAAPPPLAAQTDLYEAQPVSRSSYLGIGLVDVDAARARSLHMDSPHGAEVTRVDEGSPADKAGVKTGDVLLAYNGENILGGLQLARLVAETPLGRRVTVLCWRGGKNLTATVTTAVRPRNVESPLDAWGLGPPDGRVIVNPIEIPLTLVIWRNMILGVECETLQAPLADYFGVSRGVLLRSVQRGSVADVAGLRAGDVVVAIADHPVTSPRELTSALRLGWVPGRPLRVVFFRDHKRVGCDLTVPEDAQ